MRLAAAASRRSSRSSRSASSSRSLPVVRLRLPGAQLAYVAIYLIALIGLNVLTGYTGQISLGHGAFMAIGGYTTAILMAGRARRVRERTSGRSRSPASSPASSGFLFGFPALRLSGLYLALATFAIAVAMPAVIKRFEEFTGGGQRHQPLRAARADRRRSTPVTDPRARR